MNTFLLHFNCATLKRLSLNLWVLEVKCSCISPPMDSPLLNHRHLETISVPFTNGSWSQRRTYISTPRYQTTKTFSCLMSRFKTPCLWQCLVARTTWHMFLAWLSLRWPSRLWLYFYKSIHGIGRSRIRMKRVGPSNHSRCFTTLGHSGGSNVAIMRVTSSGR